MFMFHNGCNNLTFLFGNSEMAYFGGLKIQFENRILLKTRVRFDVLQKFFLKTGVKIAMLKKHKTENLPLKVYCIRKTQAP